MSTRFFKEKSDVFPHRKYHILGKNRTRVLGMVCKVPLRNVLNNL